MEESGYCKRQTIKLKIGMEIIMFGKISLVLVFRLILCEFLLKTYRVKIFIQGIKEYKDLQIHSFCVSVRNFEKGSCTITRT